MSTALPSAERTLIYLDNSATTPLCPAARAAMERAMDCYGNPSSTHLAGRDAHELLETARRQIGRALGLGGLKPGELIFTSCGSEADNLAILGSAYAKARRTANRILTTDSEHPAVREPLARLEADGFEIVRIPTRGGELDLAAVEAEMDERLFLVTMMLVNNETGARYPLERVFAAARRRSPGALLHCDAVQGFLKLPFGVKSLGADMVTLSAHKIGGPKGVGALWVSPALLTAKQLRPTLLGGGQENGYRSGTENVIGIAGFGGAAEAGVAALPGELSRMRSLRERLLERLAALCPEVRCNTPAVCAPHIVSLTLPRIKSETMLNYLSREGICVSSGSACSAHAHRTSAALLAYGLSAAEADATIRVSLGVQNTGEELDRFAEVLAVGVASLIRF